MIFFLILRKNKNLLDSAVPIDLNYSSIAIFFCSKTNENKYTYLIKRMKRKNTMKLKRRETMRDRKKT